MDTVTARDYIDTYPTINKILTGYPKPPFGFSEGDIYRILEEGLRVRDAEIEKLKKQVQFLSDYPDFDLPKELC